MKTVCALALIALLQNSGAAVIQDDAQMVEEGDPPYFLPFDRAFIVTSAQYLVIEVINSAQDEFTFQYQAIAEAYSLFQVAPDTEFTASFVNTQPAFMNNWNSPGSGVLTLTPGQSEYLAYWDQSSGGAGQTAIDSDSFGWAQVTNIFGQLVVTGSATADSGGIRVSTLQQIPEPGTISLLAAGVILSCVRRRRTTR